MYVILKKKFLCRLLSLIAGTVFFKVQCFLISREKLRSSIPKRHCIYFIMELAAIRYVYTTYLTGISIQGVFLFQRSRLQWSSFLKITVSLKQALAVIPFFKNTESIHHSRCSNPLYDTSLVSDMHILKHRLLFDNISCSHPFFLWYCHYFTTALELFQYKKGTVFISQHLF